jgi:hypothetical protein
MLIVRTYRCLDCEHDIERFQDSADGPPKFCENCGAEFEGDAEPVPGTHAIGGSAIARSTDLTYRQLEDSSAARAAELGAPALKITNLNDNLREGDVAAKAPDNVISRFDREAVAQGRQPITGWGGGYATPGVRVGSLIPAGHPGAGFAGPGHIALAAAQPEHAARVQQVIASTPYRPYVKGS